MAWFHTVGIIGKSPNNPKVGATIARLVAHLHARQVTVRYEPGMARALGTPELGLCPDEMGRRCDLILVVGGDGTLLATARAMSDYDVPLAGINLGRLGFLVDISPCEIESRLDQVLNGQYDADTRALLEVQIDGAPAPRPYAVEGASPASRDCAPPEVALALNDVVIAKWNTVRMIEFETYVDGHFVNAQRADGIIIATPTGSTAYALSGGGPLIHPTLDTLLLVPICPHTLSNRPLLIPGDARIEVRIRNFERDRVRLTCDGQIDLPLLDDAPIHIARSRRRIRLLHPRGHDHYWLLRTKFGWGGLP